jgi:hypothetical protein
MRKIVPHVRASTAGTKKPPQNPRIPSTRRG